MREREETNIEVIIPDLSEVEQRFVLCGLGQNILRAKIENIGLIKTNLGYHIVCEEGVANTKPLENNRETEFNVSITKQNIGNPENIIVSHENIKIKNLELINMVEKQSAKRINLANFIRTFGRRLEDNYNDCIDFFKPIYVR